MPSDPPSNIREAEPQKPGWQRMTTESVHRIEELAQERIGQTLAGRFQIKRMLAIGGMATVYEAIQSPLMRRVAVKILHQTEIEAGRRDYFLREANSAAGLRHPNIISIVDFGQEEDGTLFLAMEYVPGLTFSELLAQEYPLPPARLIHIIDQVCLALEVAHRANVIHCDMKPGNIMIESVPGNNEHVKVLDFGISRQLAPSHEEVNEDNAEIIGSYYYMAPEQIMGRPVSPRTDIYGLGVVLYTSLTASFPFDEKDDQTLMESILHKMPLPPSLVRPELNIPQAFDAIVHKALAKRPEDRFASCGELRKALLGLLAQPHTLSSGDEHSPHSLDMLLPEDELFEVDVDLESSLAGEDALQRSRASQEDDIFPDAMADDAPSIDSLLTALPPPPSLSMPARPRRSPTPLELFDRPLSALSGRPPIIGRVRQLADLERAALMTRRGTVTVHVTGPFGCGSSFFVSRALETLASDLSATVLLQEIKAPGQEFPYHSLYNLICSGLDDHAPAPEGESPLTPVALSDHRRATLKNLEMGRLEARTIEHLLDRWDQEGNTHSPVRLEPGWHPYGDGPLRFPETREQVLTHAFAELMRALIVHGRAAGATERSQRAPLVLAIDGWELCDTPTRHVVRRVLSEHRHLPLLFIAVSHPEADAELDSYPEEQGATSLDPSNDGRGWDMAIQIPPYSLDEIREAVTQHFGTPQPERFVTHLAAASGGNPLFIKEMLHTHQGKGGRDEVSPLSPERMPDSPGRLFAQQLEGLSRDGKMLLAVCTLLGATFPIAPVHVVMPAEFDVNGTLAELMGTRVLEPLGEDHTRLRFRFPKMRGTSLRRLHPKLRQGLHARIVNLLLAQSLPIRRNEAELWLAIHNLKAGEPLVALDHLLDSAEAALNRWEPELTLRRCRQAQVWINACLEVQSAAAPRNPDGIPTIDPDVAAKAPPRALEARNIRAFKLLLSAARRLQIKPERDPRALISERLPQQLLDQIRQQTTLPPTLRAETAFEIGRYFSRLELPQSARTAFALAHQIGQTINDPNFPLIVELAMVRNLHRLGRHGQASDLANELMERIRTLIPRNDRPAELSLAKPLDQLAKIYIGRRLYPRAEHYLDQARAISEADDDNDQLCKIYLHYAALYRAQSQHRRTIQALRKANDVAVKSDDLRSQARVLYNLGIASANLGKRSEGRRYLADAIEVAINLGWTDFIALVNGQIKKL